MVIFRSKKIWKCSTGHLGYSPGDLPPSLVSCKRCKTKLWSYMALPSSSLLLGWRWACMTFVMLTFDRRISFSLYSCLGHISVTDIWTVLLAMLTNLAPWNGKQPRIPFKPSQKKWWFYVGEFPLKRAMWAPFLGFSLLLQLLIGVVWSFSGRETIEQASK